MSAISDRVTSLDCPTTSPEQKMEGKVFCEHIDWATTGTFWSGVGTIGTFAVALCAAIIGFRVWKRREKFRTHSSHAIQIGIAFYEGLQSIDGIREPSMSAQELKAAEEALGERPAAVNDEEWLRLKQASAVVARTQKHSELWERISGLRATAKLLFPTEVENSLKDILLARQTVLAAASLYARTNDNTIKEKALKRMVKPWIEMDDKGNFTDPEDEFLANLEQAKTNLHAQLDPYLKDESTR